MPYVMFMICSILFLLDAKSVSNDRTKSEAGQTADNGS